MLLLLTAPHQLHGQLKVNSYLSAAVSVLAGEVRERERERERASERASERERGREGESRCGSEWVFM